MGSSKKQTVGYRYYMGMHFGLCHGPVDEVKEVRAGDRTAWRGSIADSASVSVNAPELFGGDKKEGGLQGALDVMMGGPSQAQNSYLASKLGGLVPAFRGIVSAVWRGGLVSSNNPYIKPWAFKVKRIVGGWSGGSAWNPSKAPILLPGFEPLSPVGPSLMGGTVAGGEFSSSSITSLLSAPAAGVGSAYLAAISLAPSVDSDNNSKVVTCYVAIGGETVWSEQVRFSGQGNYVVRRQINYEGHGAVEFKVGISGSTWLGALRINSVAILGSTPYSSIASSLSIGPDSPEFGVVQNAAGDRRYVYFDDPVGFGSNLWGRSDSITERGMNPAHVVYECLTNTEWGMGYPASAIDEAKFTSAADKLFSEGFGLCMIWNKQETIENFIRLVLEHAGGILYVDPATGKFALKLIRDDYVASTLPVFGPSNLVAASDYQRKAWGETVNEVTVVYRDLKNNKDASVTVQDLANIQTQGAVVAQTKQYPGIPVGKIAQRVAMRDLNALSTPLARVKLAANRKAWALIPGDVFRLNWPDFGVADVVFRVLEVNRGTLQDGTITIDAVEDVFGLPSSTYVADQPGGWTEPTSEPKSAQFRKVVEAPYWDLALSLSAADIAYLDPLSGYVETLAASPSGDSLNYEINTKTGAADYADRAVAEFCPTATLSTPISKTAGAIAFTDAIDVDLVTAGGYAIIGDEYVGITAVDASAGTATITRGLLDTVPADHATGARIWFADGYIGADPTEYASGEVVSVKMAPRTGVGELPVGAAPADSITIARRHNRPYAPGLFRISGQAYPAALVDVALSASWAHRDRLTQTAYLVQQSEGNIGPEAGTTYTVQLWNHATSTLIQGFAGLTGTSQAFASLPSGAYVLRVDLWSVRGGLGSYQKQSHVFDYININIMNTEDLNRIATEAGEVIELE